MTRDVWLTAHPYLKPVADVDALISSAVSGLALPAPRIPNWDDYTNDFHRGVALLRSSPAAVDLSPADCALEELMDTLAAQVRPEGEAWQRYLSWAVLVRYLSPLAEAFGRWRDEERWLRNYCPLCGEPPAMGQLVGTDPGRLRLLSCGCCRTRWRYRRTGCPFCENRDDHRLAVLALESEAGLRIDYCDSCQGYLKTYDGSGSETVLLADWTSLHLDVLARARGLKRLAASLYEF